MEKNTKIIIPVFVSLLLILSSLVILKTKDQPEPQTTEYKTNYQGLLSLGLIPNADSRTPGEKDEVIGVVQAQNNEYYYLIKSGYFETGDFGRVFAYRVR